MGTGHAAEALRRALLAADLDAIDVASALEVDPKTVKAWMSASGRVPHPRTQQALAALLGVSRADLWPPAVLAPVTSPEIEAVFPCRAAVPREVWLRFFRGAERRIDVLAHSGQFLVEDVEIVAALKERAEEGVAVRIALGDPAGSGVAVRSVEEGGQAAATAEVGAAVSLYEQRLSVNGVEIRLHDTSLYNSLYRSDGNVLVNHRIFGTAGRDSPVVRIRRQDDGELFETYMSSFERVWAAARPLAVSSP